VKTDAGADREDMRASEGRASKDSGGRGLSRDQRLKQSTYFREAYEQGHKWFGRYMVLWLREGEDAGLRLGTVASRRVGNSVARTRAKRLLRELFRRIRPELTGKMDVVLVARRAILNAPWDALSAEIARLARQAGLVRDISNKQD